jgi:hypothetical protein
LRLYASDHLGLQLLLPQGQAGALRAAVDVDAQRQHELGGVGTLEHAEVEALQLARLFLDEAVADFGPLAADHHRRHGRDWCGRLHQTR